MARTKGRAEIEKKNQRLEKLEIEYVHVDDVVPNPWNPNRQSEHEFELLTRSMKENGFTQPVIVMRITEEAKQMDEALLDYELGQRMIVDGEHRWRGGQAIGLDEIPVVEVPMDVAQARIATLTHNRARGSEDIELSAQLLRDLEELSAMDWAMDSLMLSQPEVDRLLADVPAPTALAGEDYGAAWEPSKGEDAEDATLSDRRASSTKKALDARREAEKRIAEAQSDEERQLIKRDLRVYRFALTFSDDEAAIVKAVIQEAPAQTVLKLCENHLREQGLLDEVIERKEEVLEGQLTATPEDVMAEEEVPA